MSSSLRSCSSVLGVAEPDAVVAPASFQWMDLSMRLLVSCLFAEDHRCVFAKARAVVEPADEDFRRFIEIRDGEVRQGIPAAVLDKRALCQHQVGTARDAEIAASVADDDTDRAARCVRELALAVSG